MISTVRGRLIGLCTAFFESLPARKRPSRFLLLSFLLLVFSALFLFCLSATVCAQSATAGWTLDKYTLVTIDGPDWNPYVAIAANPSFGGAVRAQILYNDVAYVTLTATAHRDYQFLYWTEGGRVVSTDPGYTFSTTTKRYLVANFAFIGEEPLELMPGDVNGDSRINVQDVNLVMSYLLELTSFSSEQKRAADVNNDGWINIRDVNLIMQRALNLIDSF